LCVVKREIIREGVKLSELTFSNYFFPLLLHSFILFLDSSLSSCLQGMCFFWFLFVLSVLLSISALSCLSTGKVTPITWRVQKCVSASEWTTWKKWRKRLETLNKITNEWSFEKTPNLFNNNKEHISSCCYYQHNNKYKNTTETLREINQSINQSINWCWYIDGSWEMNRMWIDVIRNSK
jgi:hypothetical protein